MRRIANDYDRLAKLAEEQAIQSCTALATNSGPLSDRM
jgi:hypothetical protein